jgi:hypothetical protein
MTLVMQKDFAAMHGVSKKTVSMWKKADRLVMQGEQVDVEASIAKLARYRKGGSPTARVPVTQPITSGEAGNWEGNSRSDSDAQIRPGETAEKAAERILIASGADMNYDEARRVKENYLALKAQLEYDRDSGLVVAVADVAKVVGDEYASVRTRLLAIPSNLAPQLLRVKTAPAMKEALTDAITEALWELTRDQSG